MGRSSIGRTSVSDTECLKVRVLPPHRMNRISTHPGVILNEEFLIPAKISPTDLSKILGISVTNVEELISGNYEVDEKIAESLSFMFETSKEFWINLQKNYSESL